MSVVNSDRRSRASRLAQTSVVVAAMSFAHTAFGQTTVASRDITSLVPHCAAPVASLVVGNFICRASACAPPPQGPASGFAAIMMMQAQARNGAPPDLTRLGDTMSSAVTTALKATGCFTVQDREAIAELKKEAELSGIEFKPKPSDYLISGSITEVSFKSNSTSIGGGMIPVIGALSTTSHEAKLALEVRILDVKDGSVTDSQSFEANSAKRDFGLGAVGFGRGGLIGGAMSSTNSPEIDSVANQAILFAVSHVTDVIGKDAVTSHPTPPGPPPR